MCPPEKIVSIVNGFFQFFDGQHRIWLVNHPVAIRTERYQVTFWVYGPFPPYRGMWFEVMYFDVTLAEFSMLPFKVEAANCTCRTVDFYCLFYVNEDFSRDRFESWFSLFPLK